MNTAVKRRLAVILYAIAAVAVMTYVEQIVKPGYWPKSIIKVIVFGVSQFVFCLIEKNNYRKMINLKKIEKGKLLIAGAFLVYLIVIGAFLFFRGMIDTSVIRNSLVEKEGLTRENCLFVFTYIIFINSFLEESFFRGFIYNQLKDLSKTKAALFSAFMFAVYHIGIVSTWFSPVMLIICISALMICGLFMQTVAIRFDSLKASWFLHGIANLAINTIGFILIFEL